MTSFIISLLASLMLIIPILGNFHNDRTVVYQGSIDLTHEYVATKYNLSNDCRSGSCIILESGRELLLGLVVPRKPVNPRLDQDKTELGVFILAIDFKMLANGNRLFDEVPKVLRDGWAKSCPQTKGLCV
jgi:hypothetical protein